MSGPAVLIGFIVLIPSIAGILFSALMFVGVNAFNPAPASNEAGEPSHPVKTDFDVSFRLNCAKQARQSLLAAGKTDLAASVEPYCECALATLKDTGSETTAAQTCAERAKEGSLEPSTQTMDALYSSLVPHKEQAASGLGFLHIFGTLSALAIGLFSFVGGLLGWLLVMKKSVLKCDFCGAVVNAS